MAKQMDIAQTNEHPKGCEEVRYSKILIITALFSHILIYNVLESAIKYIR